MNGNRRLYHGLMEDGPDGSTISSGRGGQAVILIFSKSFKTLEEWQAITKRIFESTSGWIEGATLLLDPKPSGSTAAGSNPQSNQTGRVYEIRAKIAFDAGTDNVSVDTCRTLRLNEGIVYIEKTEDVEFVFQPLEVYLAHKTPGLAVFDMDSTLIQQEVIDELARSVGRYEQVAAVTEAAMRGELDFEESLRARVAQLKGVSTDIWEHLKNRVITFTPGARELIAVLKHFGWKTAVLSGGFTPLANWVKDTLGLDYAFANQLATDESGSQLSGEVLPNTPIVGATLKRDLLLKLAAENDIPISHTLAVGDGSNDLLMMKAAGFGVAFNAKARVQAEAPARLNSTSLLDVAYVLGFTADGIAKALDSASLSS